MHDGKNPTSCVVGGEDPHLIFCFSGCVQSPGGGKWTAVDVVMRVQGLSYTGAVDWMAERGGFEGFTKRCTRKPRTTPAMREITSEHLATSRNVQAKEQQEAADPDDWEGEEDDEPDDYEGDPGPPARGEGEREGKGGGRPPGGNGGDGPRSGRGAPRRGVEITTEEAAVADEALEVLIASTVSFYQRGGAIVTIRNDVERQSRRGTGRKKGEPVICEVKPPQIRRHLSATCRLFRTETRKDKESGEEYEVTTDKHVPDWLVKDLHTRGEWHGMRELEGFAECPTLRPDGTLITKPGFDETTGLYFAPSIAFAPVPEAPTKEQAQEAAETLLGLVVDFPFDTEAHRAAWLAGLLTPMARHAWGDGQGVSPMFLIDANESGSGKGLLVELIGLILFGRQPAAMSQANNPEEERKAITTNLKEGSPLLVIDNVRRLIGGANFEALLTMQTWSDRLLGGNEQAKLPNNATWFATGNQLKTTVDMVRRCIYVRLRSDTDKPAERQGFQISDVRRFTLENRGELASAAATILVAWMQHRARCREAAGPDPKAQKEADPATAIGTWSSFRGWSDIVRGALLWLGYPDPAKTSADLAGDNEESAQLADLHHGWHELDPKGLGMSAAEVVTKLRGDFDDFGKLRSDARAPFLAALAHLTGTPADRQPSAGKLGYVMRRVKDKVSHGPPPRRLVKADNTDGNNSTRWRLEVVKPRQAPPDTPPDGSGDLPDMPRRSPEIAGDEGSISGPSTRRSGDPEIQFSDLRPISGNISGPFSAGETPVPEIRRSFSTSHETESRNGGSGVSGGGVPTHPQKTGAGSGSDLRTSPADALAPSPLALPTPPAQAGFAPTSPDVDTYEADEAQAIKDFGGG